MSPQFHSPNEPRPGNVPSDLLYRHGKTYNRIGPRGGYSFRIGSHFPKLPVDLPVELERFGLCTCKECADRAFKNPLWRHSWLTAWVPGRGVRMHSEGWRSLSWSVGDEGADWLCSWCDLDPPNAHDRLAQLVTICNLIDNDDPILVGGNVKQALYGLVERS